MTSAPIRPIEVPPFQLQPLISDLPQPPAQASRHGHAPSSSGDFDSFIRSTTEGALSNLASAAPLFSRVMGGTASPARGANTAAANDSQRQQQSAGREVKCVQAYNKDIIVGCTDGTLIRYSVRDDDGSSQGDPYAIASLQTVPGGKAVDKIALVPALGKALVLSGGVIHFYTLPALDPLPASVISPLRGVTEFAIDETAIKTSNNAPSTQNIPPIRLCVVRRRVVVVYALRERLAQVKDIPFPNGAIKACLSGPHLCLADPKSYWIVNVDAGEALELMEWSQDQSLPPQHVKPLMAVSDTSEFMLAIWTGNGALGFFMTGLGDPTRGTLDYPQHPLSICIDFPYVAALLPNGTIEIHSIVTLSIVAVLSCPTTLQPCLLSSSIGGFLVPSLQRNNAIKPVVIPLLNPPPATPSKSRPTQDPTSPPSGSGLTPPSTPAAQPGLNRSVSGRSTKSISEASFSRSGTLVSGLRGMHSLLPSTLGSQIDSLLESNRVEDAVGLLSQAREKLEKSTGLVDEGEIREILLIHQRIAYRHLFATGFEDAGKHFLLGKTDPRLLVRLFPELRGNMITTSEELSVFAGVADQARAFDSIDAIIMANLVRNYHPHIQPSVEEATPTAELRRVLNMTARDMLASFLKKSRDNVASLVVDPLDVPKVQKIVDTALLKIHIEENQTPQMMALVNMSENIIVAELEALLIEHHKFTVLSKLYEKKGDESKLLEIWTKVVDGEWKDPALANPLPRIKDLLLETKDRVLVQRYGIWLIKHDPEASLKLFTTKDSKRGMKLDENLVLRALRAADAGVGEQYLEHLVLTRRNSEPALSTQLVTSYIERLVSSLEDPEVVRMWRTALTTYTASRGTPMDSSMNSVPFLSYLSKLADHQHALARAKLALFLQGSTQYDLEAIRNRLEALDSKNLFPLETAIVYGRIGNHDGALSLLVHSLKDSTTAEAYCTLGGDVIPPKVASAVAHQMSIEPWGQLVTATSPGSGFGTAAMRGTTTSSRSTSVRAPVSEETKKALISTLMRVDDMAQETAQLLNAQAVNLDVVDVLDSVPPTWSLSVMSSFVSRSLRRTLHEHQEGLLFKGIASAQNLDVSDMAYEAMHEEGAMVEEALDSGTEAGDDLNEKQHFGEDEFISEKVPFPEDESHSVVHPIPIPPREGRNGASGSLESSRSTLR
ncbi:hypothetical protein FRC04_001601 [Tulasnella sp. 424]|nr:hypothetical protein FRC04_001601 [Tulasnella sp. 424]